MAHKTLQEIFAHNERWRQERLAEDPAFFARLSQAQTPKYLFIGCSDSRISTEALMCAEPGDVFVHRNVANVVQVSDLNVLSVVSYALGQLAVEHIVVCGHYGCGGVKAALSPGDLGVLNPWLSYLRDVYRLHLPELNALEADARCDRLVELNVLEQCVNLVKLREVQRALAAQRVGVHGWVFDMRTGQLKDLRFDAARVSRELLDLYALE